MQSHYPLARGLTIKHLILLLALLIATPAPTQELQDSNTPEVQKWFAQLTNKQGGSCCGQGDAYPAKITKMPPATDEQGRDSYAVTGEVCVIDTSAKQVVKGGTVIKQRVQINGNPCHKFSWMKLTREKQGNPFDYVIAFVALGPGGEITDVYCVVPLAQIY